MIDLTSKMIELSPQKDVVLVEFTIYFIKVFVVILFDIGLNAIYLL